MWFKNLQIFQLKEPFPHSQDELEQALASNQFRPCGPLEVGVQGWSSPLGNKGPFCLAANGCFLLCLRREDKILPASVVNDLLTERVEQLESEEMRTLSRREKRMLKDDIYHELLPKAFTRSLPMYAYVDPHANRILVDSASSKKAEDLISQLRKSLSSLPARPLGVQHAPADIMTRWLKDGDLPDGFTLSDQCELRDPDEAGGIVRCRHQELDSEEIQTHLRAGKRAVQLAVEWENHVGLVLTDQPALKRLRFADRLVEEAADAAGDDPAALVDADLSLMTLELRRLVDRIVEIFGGMSIR